MKKHLFIIPLLALLLLGVRQSLSAWVIQAGEDYSVAKHDDREVVAHIKGTTRKFTSVSAAVRAANNINGGGTVVVYASKNPVVSESFTIDNDVTLLLSYDSDNPETTSNKEADVSANGTSISTATLTGSLIVNNTLDSLLTITNNGTIEIGGVLSGGRYSADYSGQTYGAYSQIVLGDNTCLLNKGTINCFGYIKNGAYDAGSKTITYINDKNSNRGYVSNKSASFNLPFILRDYRGGTVTVAIKQSIDTYHVPPFNQIELRNVMCKMICDLNTRCVGWANLWTDKLTKAGITIPAQMNSTDIYLFGLPNGDNKYIIEPNNDCSDFKLISYYFENSQNQEIWLYGGAKTNIMSLSVNIPVIGSVTVTTENVYFPLSFRQNVYLNKTTSQSSASYTMGQMFKIMSGCKLVVGENTTLKANNMCVYKESDFVDTAENGIKIAGAHYPTGKGDGRLIVNGIFECSNFGGHIIVEASNASVNITNSPSITSYEVKTIDNSSTLPTGYKIDTALAVNQTLTLDVFEYYDQNSLKTLTGLSNGNYKSVERSGSYGFVTSTTKYKINYINNSSDASFDESLVNMAGCISYFNVDTNNALVVTYSGGDYLVEGFYLDETCTNDKITSINGASLINNLNNEKELDIYIKWKRTQADVYKITFKYYQNGTRIEKTYAIDDYDITSGYSISNPNDFASGTYENPSNYKFEYNFSGWRLAGNTYQAGDALTAETLRNVAISNDGVIAFEGVYDLKTYVWANVTNVTSDSNNSVVSPSGSQWIGESDSVTVECGSTYTSGFLFWKKTYTPKVTVTIGASSVEVSAGNTRTFSASELAPLFTSLTPLSIVGSWTQS